MASDMHKKILQFRHKNKRPRTKRISSSTREARHQSRQRKDKWNTEDGRE